MRIDSTSFGNVIIDKFVYSDVLIIDGKIVERNLDLLHKIFGTGHVIAQDEISMLLKDSPELIVIGNGQDGVLKVKKEQIEEMERICKVVVEKTPDAIKKINDAIKEGKKVNALIHTTC